MFLHVISPTRAFTKMSNALILHRELDVAARFLIGYVGGLMPAEQQKPLHVHAEKLGLKPAVYKKAKKELVRYGYVRDYRCQGPGGLWSTEQYVSNVPLTEDQFTALRCGDGLSPGVPNPTAGEPDSPSVGRSTGTYKTDSKTTPTRPPQEAAANTPQKTPSSDRHFAVAERILRDLRVVRSDLYMSFRNVRYLAGAVAEQLREGVPAWEVHAALTHGLPDTPIRNAAGFVTHRLGKNLPGAQALTASDAAREQEPHEEATAPRLGVVKCRGLGRPGEHHFRPVGDETHCDPCRREHPGLAALAEEEHGGAWAPLPTVTYTGEPPY
ncbi:hypothetical protein [Streptomyces sp. NPDC051561]|uniref:hypothetical protein n=1 Tax=Streptomyces sp. NPDC051561 TaxID=3365658 RepID=UPI0037B120DD